MTPDPERMVNHLRYIDEVITGEGFAIQSVFPTTKSEGPWFAYTIGLYPNYPAEIIMRGFGDSTADMVDTIAHSVTTGRLVLTEGIHDLLTGQRVRIDLWSGDPANFGMANWYHGTDDYPRFHVVIADDEGRLPGEPGCEVEKYQMLGLPFKGDGPLAVGD